jgi:hypothetical protein
LIPGMRDMSVSDGQVFRSWHIHDRHLHERNG